MLSHYRFEDDCCCHFLDAGILVKDNRNAQDRVNDKAMYEQCRNA